MADLTLSERLQPSLLDRITDTAPDRRTESRESRVIDMRRLREILQRDLSWLLNTFDHSAEIDADRFPYASASSLNYGVREVAGEYSTAARARLIRASILRAIEKFEPRIRAETLDVELRGDQARGTTLVTFDIRAEMWAQPLPMELYLRSEVDVTTGELRLARPGEGLRGLRDGADTPGGGAGARRGSDDRTGARRGSGDRTQRGPG